MVAGPLPLTSAWPSAVRPSLLRVHGSAPMRTSSSHMAGLPCQCDSHLQHTDVSNVLSIGGQKSFVHLACSHLYSRGWAWHWEFLSRVDFLQCSMGRA